MHPGTGNKHTRSKARLPGSWPCFGFKGNLGHGCSPALVNKAELSSMTRYDLLHTRAEIKNKIKIKGNLKICNTRDW